MSPVTGKTLPPNSSAPCFLMKHNLLYEWIYGGLDTPSVLPECLNCFFHGNSIFPVFCHAFFIRSHSFRFCSILSSKIEQPPMPKKTHLFSKPGHLKFNQTKQLLYPKLRKNIHQHLPWGHANISPHLHQTFHHIFTKHFRYLKFSYPPPPPPKKKKNTSKTVQSVRKPLHFRY